MGKFASKNQNCQFELKFRTQTNSNTQNSMVVFTFSVLDEKQPFLGKFGPKSHNCQFMLKSGTVKLVYNDYLGDEVSAVVIDR